MIQRASKRPDPAPPLAAVARAVAEPGQPEATLKALDAALQDAVGHRLFTVLVINHAAKENQRYYSSRPKEYPVGGAKPLGRTSIVTDAVLAGRCHINRDRDGIKAAFFDHELIYSLGCEGSINVPVRFNGQTLAMFALLDAAGAYGEDDIPTLSAFAAMAVPAVQMIIAGWTGASR